MSATPPAVVAGGLAALVFAVAVSGPAERSVAAGPAAAGGSPTEPSPAEAPAREPVEQPGVEQPGVEPAVAHPGVEQPGIEQRRPAPPRPDRARPDRTAVLPPTHTVEPGDTLGRVAERYAVSAGSLAEANAVTFAATLRPGQELVIPGDDLLRLTTPEEVVAANLAVEGLLAEAGAAFGLDAALVQAVAWVETRWEQRVVSSQEAIGIMQVRRPTGEAMAGQLGRDLDLHDVGDNVVAGAAYLATLLDRHHGDVHAALAGYHQGPGSVREQGWLATTRRYVADVLAAQERFTHARR